MEEHTSNLAAFSAAGTWRPTGDLEARSGDLSIALDPDDPTRWRISKSDGSRLLDGRVPRFGVATLLEALDYDLCEFGLTTDGLADWADAAEGRAHAVFDEEDERAELAAADPYPGALASDILAVAPKEPNWLVPGVSAPGWVTKIGGREKLGKGTLATNLVGKLERGEDSVFGPAPDRPVTALIFTEEPADSLNEKLRLAGIAKARVVYSWELSTLDWHGKVDMLLWIAYSEGRGLVFIDNVSRAAGVEDEAGTELARALEYLGDKCRAHHIAGWVDHHHKKGHASDEDASRGSTSIVGAVDVSLDLFRAGRKTADKRVRRLRSVGRVRAANWERSIELNEQGTDYSEVTPEAPPDPEAEAMTDFYLIPDEGCTVEEYRAIRKWSRSKAARALNDLVADGMATVDDSGKAYRYFRAAPETEPGQT